MCQLESHQRIEWGRGKKGGEEEWKVGKETVLSSLTPLSSSDLSSSYKEGIKEENGMIIKIDSLWENRICIINKELKKVYR